MPLRLQIVVTALLAASLVAGWMWFSGRDEPAMPNDAKAKKSSASLVLVEALDLAEDRVVLRLVGTGEALRSASIYPTVAGHVVEVLFEAEQRVRKGAPLVHLDNEDERLAVRLAEVAAKEARRDVKRLEKLVPSGAVSVVRLETSQAAFESQSDVFISPLEIVLMRTGYFPDTVQHACLTIGIYQGMRIGFEFCRSYL